MYEQRGRCLACAVIEIDRQPGNREDGDQAPPFEAVEDKPPGKPMQNPRSHTVDPFLPGIHISTEPKLFCKNIDLQVTASFGVAKISNQFHTSDEIITSADMALYRSKNQGKNRVSGYPE